MYGTDRHYQKTETDRVNLSKEMTEDYKAGDEKGLSVAEESAVYNAETNGCGCGDKSKTGSNRILCSKVYLQA